MEWADRALANWSIFALSPYVLDNLNTFLKQRERHRAYGLSAAEEDVPLYFQGPLRSPWTEYEYRPKEPRRFSHVMPPGALTLRVRTIDDTMPLVRQLHRAFKARTDGGFLVNKSFNGFSEPIVCSRGTRFASSTAPVSTCWSCGSSFSASMRARLSRSTISCQA
jgi:predicted NodU family carbamoyl transferase